MARTISTLERTTWPRRIHTDYNAAHGRIVLPVTILEETWAMVLIHLDTDLGGDIDDLCALAMVLCWPGAKLLAVTSNSDDGGRRAGYARRALDLGGRPDIPVAAGADAADGHYRVWPGLPDEAAYWPAPEGYGPVPPCLGPVEVALDLLAASIARGATVVAIGAMTNLALLEARQPGILRGARLVLMGGYLVLPSAGFPQWSHRDDWNMQVDAPSALAVLQSSDPLLVPLSVTVETALAHGDLVTLRQGGPLARLIAHQALAFQRDEHLGERLLPDCPALPRGFINFLHDALACAIALGYRDEIEIRTLPVVSSIEGGWLCQRADPAGCPTRLVTGIGGEAFNAQWLRTVAGGTDTSTDGSCSPHRRPEITTRAAAGGPPRGVCDSHDSQR
jgi:purine nucleosidase